MPVSGEVRSFASRRDGKTVYSESPEIIETMYVVGGTMEFNRRPGREVFTIQYEPGTPISDGLRKMQYEFGQQRAPARPTRAEAEASLREQLAEAEAQKSRLVVASPRPGSSPWLTWLTWGFGVLALVSIVLWIQRRHR